MDPSEGTLIRVNADRLDFRIDNFNLVIRLSIAQQLAISFMSLFCAVLLILPSLVNLWNLKLYSTEAAPNSQKLFFITAAQAIGVDHEHDTWNFIQAGPCL